MQLSIVIPTYNERNNIIPLVDGIRNSLKDNWDYELIFVDDGSPDGTSKVIHQLSNSDSRIRLENRFVKMGLGSAVIHGFRVAKGEYVVMMDADLSHRPEDLPNLVSGLANFDLVVGSRYVPNGHTRNWPILRRVTSIVGCYLGRWVVGIKVRDITSGFAGFRMQFRDPLLPKLQTKGFKLRMEMVAKSPNAKVEEVPIVFVERSSGQSKMTFSEIGGYIRSCFSLRFGWS